MEKVLALLLTDLVDSTAINARLGDEAMAELWDRHDAISRELALEHGGREIDRSDGFLMVFDQATEAVTFATEYHRRLTRLREPIRARAGIHVGLVRLRTNNPEAVSRGAKPLDVVGIAKATTARLMTLAQGGQTLVSADVARLLTATPWRCVSHGFWSLKGLDEPLEVFEVGDELSPMRPPPDGEKAFRVVARGSHWVTLAQVPRSLPAERDRFVGRVRELQALSNAFEEPQKRLLVLHGPGGCGKTRLAVRFAWAWLGRFPGGAYFCDLSGARDAEGVFHAVAHALEVPPGTDPSKQLEHAIAARGPALLILDNFEQVAVHAGQTLGRWLDAAPEARFLVTSRETLGIPGEHTSDLEPLNAEDAAALLVERARAAGSAQGGELAGHPAIPQLVTLLDGLPLAIELAAARLRVMTPAQLLARMSERFTVLASRAGRLDRQATLRASIDASWEALSAVEQLALAQLAVFENGFTLEHFEHVADLTSHGAVWAPDILQSLVDKSLVRRQTERRLGLLRSIQDYAARRLALSPQIEAEARARHWQLFASLPEAAALSERCADAENIVTACRRALAAGDDSSAAEAALRAWTVLRLTGPFRTAIELAGHCRALSSLGDRQRAAIEWVAGSAHVLLGQPDTARDCFERGLSLATGDQDPDREARLHTALAELLAAGGETGSATAHVERALALSDRLGDASLLCHALNAAAGLAQDRGDVQEAEARYRSALGIARKAGDRRWEGGLLGNLGTLHYGAGRFEEALSCYEQALALALQIGDRQWEGNTRSNLGLLLHEQARYAEARAQYESALQLAAEMGHARLQATVQCNLGLTLEAEGQYAQSLAPLRRAVDIARDLRDARAEGRFLACLGRVCARLGESAAALQAFKHAARLLAQAEDRTGLALLHCAEAQGRAQLGRRRAALQSLASARELSSQLGAAPGTELERAIDAAQREVEQAELRVSSPGCG